MTNPTSTKELKIEIVGEEVRISWPLPEECCELCGARARRELNKDLDKISDFKELRTYLLGAFTWLCPACFELIRPHIQALADFFDHDVFWNGLPHLLDKKERS